MIKTEEVVDGAVRFERRVRFWYDGNEPASNLFTSMHSLYLYGYVDYSKRLQQATPAELKSEIDANTTFVHLTLKPEKLGERLALLSARGIATGSDRRRVVPSMLGPVHVIMQDVIDMSSLH
jgi:hypothetical protein